MKMLRWQRNGPFVANQVSVSLTCSWQRRLLNSVEWRMRKRLPVIQLQPNFSSTSQCSAIGCVPVLARPLVEAMRAPQVYPNDILAPASQPGSRQEVLIRYDANFCYGKRG